MLQDSVSQFRQKISAFGVAIPKLQVVLGSGFGTALDGAAFGDWRLVGEIAFRDLALLSSSAPDHAGKYRVYEHSQAKITVLFQMGRLHGYEGHPPSQVVRPVMVPRLAGVEYFLLTNAAGALMPDYKAGEVMLIRDHVNLTGQNPLAGPNPQFAGKEIGPRFPDMGETYDRAWSSSVREGLKTAGLIVHEGTYLGVFGPSFETPAEVALFASWGLQAVGMSTVWEAIALRHSGARLAGLSLISNPGAGMSNEKLDHFVILDTCRGAAAKIVAAIFRAMEKEWL